MKINLSSIDREQFIVKEGVIAGEVCHLVTPQHVGCKWTKDNLIFRSSIWNSAGELISASWKKHFNLGEQPDIDPMPDSLGGVELMEKLDGSTLLISRYKDTLIVRSRGTFDAYGLDNGDEIDLFKARYPKLFDRAFNYPELDSCPYTLVCEWVSPRNRIVIAYPEADLYLTGLIWHDSYSYAPQDQLDRIAAGIGIKRPKRYSFNTLTEMVAAVEAFDGVEGVCAYFDSGRTWRKIKGLKYLALHRFKENATLSNVLDLYMSMGRPVYETFKDELVKVYDWESFRMVEGYCRQVCDTGRKLADELAELALDIEPLKNWLRRDAALHIKAKYPTMSGPAFTFLNGQTVEDKTFKKLMEERL